MVDFGKRIKAKRHELGISAEQLANESGLSVASIRAYEGMYRVPRDTHKEAIADALGMTIPALFF